MASGHGDLTETNGKVITCRAAVFWEKGQPAKIDSVDVEVPKKDEIRIKMVGTGICHTDISASNGMLPMDYPTIVGHEGVGVVESVGADVKDFKTGDPVIPLWAYQCKACRWCEIGRRNLCKTALSFINGRFSDGSTRISCKGKDVTSLSGLGLFSEYVVVNQLAALKIEQSPKLENLCLYGCCMPTGYGAAVHTAKVFPGAVCAVWGLGAIGLAVVMGCKDAGAAKIIGINRGKEKFELGKALGCTDCISPRDHDGPLSKVLKDMTGGEGPDFVFVCVGNKGVLEDAFQACSGTGECVILGLDPDHDLISINHKETVWGKTVKGSFCGDCFSGDIKKMVDDYMNGKLPSDSLITRTLPLESINEGFEALKAGKAIRTVIKF